MEIEKPIYKELSYKIKGACIKVHNNLGYGLREKTYRLAMRKVLSGLGLSFQEELYAPIEFEGEKLEKQYLDFLVDGKIILELKAGRFVKPIFFEQIKSYLHNIVFK